MSAPHVSRPRHRDRGPFLTLAALATGVCTVGLLNRARRRPLWFEPWWHVAVGGGAAYFGHRLGTFYDDTDAFMSRQLLAHSRLPTWVYPQLSPDELDAELRIDRASELQRKWAALALAEERVYLERLKAAPAQ